MARFNLNIASDVEKDYSNFCENVKKSTEKFRNGMEKIIDETRYEPTQNLLNSMIEIFDASINEIKKKNEEWKDGEHSFRQGARRYQAGEDTEEQGKRLDDKICEIFGEILGNHAMGEKLNRNDLVEAEFDDKKHFDEVEKIFKDYKEAIENEGSERLKKIENKASDNLVYGALKSRVEDIKTLFEKIIKTCEKKLKEFREDFRNFGKEQKNANQEAVSEAKTKSSATAEQVAASLKMWENVDF